MSIINKYIGDINSKNEKVLSVFLTAGFPGRDTFIDTAKGILDSGADMLEIGIPFSDPLADGPVIQLSSKAALDNGINIKDCLKYAEILSAYSSKPLIFMGYGNPVKKYGVEKFMRDSGNAGISGVIIPDVPLEEYDSFYQKLEFDILPDIVLLTTPTSTEERIKRIDAKSKGFVYCVSVTGTTGVNEGFTEQDYSNLKRTRSLINNKMLIGFGISKPEDVRNFSSYCDGVIVGSAVIKSLLNSRDNKATFRLVAELKKACEEN
jgi:tryptophan synthase alpha chain